MAKGTTGISGEESAFRRMERAMNDRSTLQAELKKSTLKYQLEHAGDKEKFEKRYPTELAYNYAVQDHLNEFYGIPNTRGAILDALGEGYRKKVAFHYKQKHEIKQAVRQLVDESLSF